MSASKRGIVCRAHLYSESAEAPRRKLTDEDLRRYMERWAKRKKKRA